MALGSWRLPADREPNTSAITASILENPSVCDNRSGSGSAENAGHAETVLGVGAEQINAERRVGEEERPVTKERR